MILEQFVSVVVHNALILNEILQALAVKKYQSDGMPIIKIN